MALPTVVQSALAVGVASSALGVTLPGHVNAGRLLAAVVCGVRVLGAPTFSLADDQGSSWSEATTLTMDLGVRRLSLHTARQIVAGKPTITVTPSAVSDLTLIALELSSIDPAQALTAVNTATGSGLTPSQTLVPKMAEGIILGAFTHLGVSTTLDSGSGYTRVQENANPAVGPVLHVETRTMTSPDLLTIDGTLGISATWGLLAAAFPQWNTYFSVG